MVSTIPDDAELHRTLAQWSITEWGRDFPEDTAETYLGLYARSLVDPDTLPTVFVALDGPRPVGTATLVDDDELPDATEPGPWLAATYVEPAARNRRIGGQLVEAVEQEARRLGHGQLFLYTHDADRWYARRQWSALRSATLTGRTVTVMSKIL